MYRNSLTRAETVAGWLYLPFYLVLLSPILQYLLALCGLEVSSATLNLIYFAINFAAVLIIFRRFLSQPFFGGRFWHFVQSLILGGVLHYTCTWALAFVAEKLSIELVIHNNNSVGSMVLQSPYLMLFVAIILAPITEEVLLRGLVFGSIAKSSRAAAYIVSMLIFSFMHSWQFFFTNPVLEVLLGTLMYLPAAGALAWTYARAGTIWAPIALHAIINAVTYNVVSLP